MKNINTKENKDISVLMTVYNGGQYLRRAVDSVLAQSFSNFEFLIVNDASTDGSLQILKAYQDRRIRIIHNSLNKGQTASLNIGLRQTRAEFIARMDADDIAFPGWLEKVYGFARKNKEYSVVSCQALIIDEDNKIKQYTGLPLSYQEVILKNIIASAINHVGSLMRREAIAGVGGYDDKYRIAADYDLWTRLLIGGHKLVNINEILTAIRIHSVSTSMRGESMRNTEVIDIMQKNIRNFSNYSITKDETRILWEILHNIKKCDDEICSADKIINNIYDAIKAELGLPNSLVQNIKEIKKQEIFKKRIFILLQNSKYNRARDVLKEHMRAKGWLNFFGIVYFLSFFSVFTKNIEVIYYNILSFLTKVRFSNTIKRLKNKSVLCN